MPLKKTIQMCSVCKSRTISGKQKVREVKYIKKAKIEHVNSDDWKFGNIFNFGKYRDTETYIIDENLRPISNPDVGNSGYLSIPFSITKNNKNAYELYSKYLFGGTIDLRPDDKFLVKKYGTALPKHWKITVVFLDGDGPELIWIKTDESHDFNFNETSLESMIEVVNSSIKI